MKDQQIMCELERLAAAFPWDKVEVDLRRTPEGQVDYLVYVPDNPAMGMNYALTCGTDLTAAVDRCIAENAANRDPHLARKRKVEELKATLAKLMAVEIGMPPYRPNRELAQHVNSAPVDV